MKNKKKPQILIIEGIEYEARQCTKCKVLKPLTQFHNSKKGMFGKVSICRECKTIYSQKHYKNNDEKYKLKNKIVYENDRQKRIDYVLNNPKKKEIQKKYISTHEEYYKDYYGRNVGKFKNYNLKRKEKEHNITNIEWEACKFYFNHRCAYCGLPIEEHYIKRRGKLVLIDFHKEHSIWDGKNNIANCVPACQKCNSHKWIFSLNNWYNPNNEVYTYERYYRIYQWLRYDYKKYIQKKKPKGKYTKKNMDYWNNK